MIYIWILEIPEEDVCKVEVGELGKIVELGREDAKEVDEEADRRNPPPPTHLGFLYHNTQINWPTLKDIDAPGKVLHKVDDASWIKF